VTLLAGLALVALAWPGWLHARPDDPRESHRVAWHVEAEPALRRAAEQLREVQDPDRPGHTFNYNWHFGAYCAWFCPGEKTYFDTYRLELFNDRVKDFTRIRKALSGQSGGNHWQQVFRDEGINHVVLADQAVDRVMHPLMHLWFDRRQWVQPAVGNISTVFGWQDPDRPTVRPFGHRTLDLNALAFGPRTPNRAPDAGPGIEPEAPGRGDWFYKTLALVPWEVTETNLYRNYYLLHQQYWRTVYARANGFAFWSATAASTGIGTGNPLVLGAVHEDLADRLVQLPGFALQRLLTNQPLPEAAPVLAVRSARRAIAANPSDAECYMALVRAYYLLWQRQDELRGPPRQPILPFPVLDVDLLQTLRAVQLVNALNRALVLRPSLVEAHLGLVQVYEQMNYRDMALRHFEEAVRHMRENPPRRNSGETTNAFRVRREQYQKTLEWRDEGLKALQHDMAQRLKEYRFRADGKSLQERIQIALWPPVKRGDQTDPRGLGLAEESLKLLARAKGEELAPQMANWTVAARVKLLLTMGHTQEVRQPLLDLTKAADKAGPVKSGMLFLLAWFEALRAAADGDYEQADRLLEEIELRLLVPDAFALRRFFFSTANVALRDAMNPLLFEKQFFPYPLLMREGQIARARAINGFQNAVWPHLRRQAELHLVRGLVALEHGNTPVAAASFRRCLTVSQDFAGWYPDRHIADRYLEALKRQKKESKR
jgi:tetratricopeptide (TPR) repeat protein